MGLYPHYILEGDQQDTLGNDYSVIINKEIAGVGAGGPPDPTYITMRGDPVVIKLFSNNRDIYDTLKFLSHEVALVTDSENDFSDLTDSNDYRDFQIETENDDGSMKTYLDPIDFKERYNIPSVLQRTVKHVGYEGFHILKDIPITDINGDAFEGYVTCMEVIAAALRKLPVFSYTIKVASTLIEANHSGTVSALSETYIRSESLYEDNELISSLDAFERILGTFGLEPHFVDDSWWLIRTAERYRTSMPYYQYSALGAFQSASTFNPQITLTGNGVARASRIDWVNGNATRQIRPPAKNIKTICYYNIRQSFFDGSFFNTFDINNVPDQWNAGIVSSINLNTGSYIINGKTCYPVELPTQNVIGYRELDRRGDEYQLQIYNTIYTDEIDLEVLLAAPYAVKVRITITYRSESNDGSDRASLVDLLYLYKGSTEYQWNGDSFVQILPGDFATWQFTENVIPNDEFTTRTIEFVIGAAASNNQRLVYRVGNFIDRKENGDAYPDDSDGNSTFGGTLVLKNVKFEAFYENPETGDFEELPDNNTWQQTNSNARGNDYEKTIYYHDYHTTPNSSTEEMTKRLMLSNLLYYKSGADYYYTEEWDYADKGLSETIQEIMQRDLQYQYSAPIHVLTGELMGGFLKSYNVFQDPKDGNRLFIPVNFTYSIKYCRMRCELMELRSEIEGEEQYIIGESTGGEGLPLGDSAAIVWE